MAEASPLKRSEATGEAGPMYVPTLALAFTLGKSPFSRDVTVAWENEFEGVCLQIHSAAPAVELCGVRAAWLFCYAREPTVCPMLTSAIGLAAPVCASGDGVDRRIGPRSGCRLDRPDDPDSQYGIKAWQQTLNEKENLARQLRGRGLA
jgi:hypothetical protein